MMYRLLKDWIAWKGTYFNLAKFKLGRYRSLRATTLCLLLILFTVCNLPDSVHCTESELNSLGKSNSYNSNNNNDHANKFAQARTISEHGLFRHDHSSSSDSNSGSSGSSPQAITEIGCQNGIGCQSPSLSPSSSTSDGVGSGALRNNEPDNRNKYTYERFKRSVTTLNFHPKTRNESKNVGLKPLRIFRYITEDDVLVNPSSHSERQVDTVFKPFVKANMKMKSDSDRNNYNDNYNRDSSNNNQNHGQVVGGARVNLKAKLDKESNGMKTEMSDHVINNNEANNHKNNESDSESKPQAPIHRISPSKPENILIFKPTLAIRKNKASLIPSGKYNGLGGAAGVGRVNRIIAATAIAKTAALTQSPPPTTPTEQQHEDESTDPNSSTVNDRSLIHSNSESNNKNIYFDSVVMLNEKEGQMQQLLQQHQSVEKMESHREKTENFNSNSDAALNENTDVGSGDVDAEMVKNIIKLSNAGESEEAPSFSFTSSSDINDAAGNGAHDGNGIKSKTSPKKVSPTLLQEVDVASSSKNKNSDMVEKLIQAMNATISGNKDRLIVTVVNSKKSKMNSNSRNSSNAITRDPKSILAQDDIAQDGSERSRRSSPFNRMPIRLSPQQAQSIRRTQLTQANGGQKLARAALFRRNTAFPANRMNRKSPVLSKKLPRVLTPAAAAALSLRQHSLPRKLAMGRTILPMKPMPMNENMNFNNLHALNNDNNNVPNPQNPPNLALVPGPMSASAPSITAIKVTQLHPLAANNANKNPHLLTQHGIPTGKDLTAQQSRTIYTYKPLPEGILLNQAASSYFSPAFKRFRTNFNNEMSTISDPPGNLELDENSNVANTWEESRFPPGRHIPRHHRRLQEAKIRSRSSGRHHRARHHRNRQHNNNNNNNNNNHYERRPHSHHRSGHHISHSPRHSAPRSKKLHGNPKYVYPKNAENIQDILNFFDKEAPGIHGPPESFDKEGSFLPKRNHNAHAHASSLPSSAKSTFPNMHPKLADLSGEFKDVHASLLKDIREFAKRPNLFGASSFNQPHGTSLFGSSENEPPFDPIHEIFGGEKPKPVRNLIKPDLYSLENIRERIAFKRGKLRGKHRDTEKDIHGDSTGSHRNIQDLPDDYDYDHRPFRHHSTHSGHSSSGGGSTELKNSLFSREEYDNPSSSYTRREKYRDNNRDDSHTIFPSSHYKDSHSHHRESSPYDFQSSEIPGKPAHSNKPVIIKRPGESFKIRETEPKKKPEHDYFWNNFAAGLDHKGSEGSILKSHSHSFMQQPYSVSSATQTLGRPISAEEEDIVEIHTGNPGGNNNPGSYLSYPSAAPTVSDHHLKQEKLKKLYMDVLQQKMQIEAALLHPHTVPSIHQQLIPQMHQSGSLQPQHSPYTMNRVPTQMTTFHAGTQPVTLPPLTGIAGVSRRKKPMRMKIHIYPNGNDGLEQGLEAANLLTSGGFGTSGYSASHPQGIVAAPPKEIGVANRVSHAHHESAMSSMPTGSMQLHTSPSGFSSAPSFTGPMTTGTATTAAQVPVAKNKNVVLHLHVHRRNDEIGPLELETEGSNPIPATAKPPASFKKVFDEQVKNKTEKKERSSSSQNHHRRKTHRVAVEEPSSSLHLKKLREMHFDEAPLHSNHRHTHLDHASLLRDEDAEHDKISSMEAPMHDEKIDDIVHSIMTMRKSGTNKGADNRKKRRQP